ncbi:MAG: hypothetical protein SVV03_01610 [Candidatus Nanohaloarchaea archaeon]|nr:hypothetical protein [Candidatus Nanohaloarchaea archaeon]
MEVILISTLKRIGIASFAKFMAFWNLIFGFIGGAVGFIGMVLAGEFLLGLGYLISAVAGGFIGGYIGGAIAAWLANLALDWSDGVEIEFEG